MSATVFPARFGKYILLDRIASGGMAEVFRAKIVGTERFQRLVAIKCMLKNLVEDEHFTTMFIDEAKMAAQLNHANIAHVLELGNNEGQLYIAMDLINGHDLRHVMRISKKRKTRLPFPLIAYVVSKAAEGLSYVHRKGGFDGKPLNLVHRDVSPQNILLSYDGEVKVVDFGIAKAEQRATETQAGIIKGKFSYMAPEQVRGLSLDARSDVFALGLVLIELLMGEKLYTGKSDIAILEMARNPIIPMLNDVVPDAPKQFQVVLNRALALQRDDRYEDALDMAEDLQGLMIDGQSIYGARNAAIFMENLYEGEIAELGNLSKRYAAVGPEDCIDVSSETFISGATTIYESVLLDTSSGGYRHLGQTHALSEESVSGVSSPGARADRSGSHGSAKIRIEPTGSNSFMRAGLPRVRGSGPTVILRLLCLLIVLLTTAIGYFLSEGDLGARLFGSAFTPESAREVAVEPAPAELVEAPAEDAADTAAAPVEVPQPVEEPVVEFGFISIQTIDSAPARVYVNGDEVGTTPILRHRVPIGEVTIRLVQQVQRRKPRVFVRKVQVEATHTEAAPKELNVAF